jgi:hypothetical protein
MTDDGPICAYCKRGTDERRLVSVYVRMSEGRRFYAHEACARRNDAKSPPPDPLFKRRRPIPTLSERLDQWNSLAGELIDLFEEYQSAPRVKATMEAACDVFNGVSWRATDMTWALGDPRQDRPDEAGDQVRILRWHIELFARAIERDPSLKGRRGVSDLEAPDLRLNDTLEALRDAYAKGLRGRDVVTKELASWAQQQ